MRCLIALDRDGTVNVERNYLSSPDQLELLPGVVEGIRALRVLGCAIVVVTNQSAVARGFIDSTQLDRIHERLQELLRDQGVQVDAFFVCPHMPDAECRCRKPGKLLLEEAVQAHGLEEGYVVVIGDQASDIEMGHRFGAATMLVLTGYGERTLKEGRVQPDYVVTDLVEAAAIVGNHLQVIAPAASGAHDE